MTGHGPLRLAMATRSLALLAALGIVAGSVSGSVPAGLDGRAAQLAQLVGSPTQATSTGQEDAPRLIGPTPASQRVSVTLVLHQPKRAELDQYLAGINDPASASYHRFLTAAQFGARFGLPTERLTALEGWAASAGLAVVSSYPQRTALRLEAQAAQVQQLFGAQLVDYFDPPTGIVFHVPATNGVVPAAIAGDVDAIAGLSSEPPRHGAVHAEALPAADPTKGPIGGFGPVDLAKAYDIVPLYEAGYLGEGQTIAIISWATFKPSDIDTYNSTYGIDASPVERIAVGPPVQALTDGSVEAALDINVIHAIAPHAQVLLFEARLSAGVRQADMVDAIVADGRANIISESWGWCDAKKYMPASERLRGERSMEAAVAAGDNLFVASGDYGAFTCWQSSPSDHSISTAWPADSAYAIAVGGTRLEVRSDGTYYGETGWETYLRTHSTGGGLSPVDARPAWQVGAGVVNERSNGKRQIPDVAADGDPFTGYSIYVTSMGEKGWGIIGGTSAAAPLWAGIAALTQQFAATQGITRLGYLNPVLYDLAARYPPNTIFHDVVGGGNLNDTANVGWDYATGLGSPDVTALADAIVLYLLAHPGP